MRTLDEVRQRARVGLTTVEQGAVLLVGFRPTDGSSRQFRTNTTEGRADTVPPLDNVAADRSTLIMPLEKREKSPYEEFFFIGRAATADLVLDDPSISKSHAAFQYVGGVWYVKDARSRNGTYVDGRKLGPGERVEIESGTQVTFGAVATYFVDSAHLRRLL